MTEANALPLPTTEVEAWAWLRRKVAQRPAVSLVVIAWELGVPVADLCAWALRYQPPKPAPARTDAPAVPMVAQHNRPRDKAAAFLAWRREQAAECREGGR